MAGTMAALKVEPGLDALLREVCVGGVEGTWGPERRARPMGAIGHGRRPTRQASGPGAPERRTAAVQLGLPTLSASPPPAEVLSVGRQATVT
jgi:hypothetical protein